MLHLFLVRHGETEWNAVGKIQGVSDIPLNEKGFSQAGKIGEYLSPIKPGAIYSSNLVRAVETATAIAAHHDMPIIQKVELQELNYGEWEGLTKPEIEANNGISSWKNFRDDPLNNRPPGAETIESLFERSKSIFSEIINSYQSGEVIVVSHGGCISALLAIALGGQKEAWIPIWLGNTSLSRISIDTKTGKTAVSLVNDLSHLGQNLDTW